MLLDLVVLLHELDDLVQFEDHLLRELVLVLGEKVLQIRDPLVEVDGLLDVRLPLLDLLAVVAGQVQDLVVGVVDLDAVLVLELCELVTEAVIQADYFLEVNHFNFVLLTLLRGQCQRVDFELFKVVVGVLVFVFDENAVVGLQFEESKNLLALEAALREEAALDAWDDFDFRLLEVFDVLLGLVEGRTGVFLDVVDHVVVVEVDNVLFFDLLQVRLLLLC